MPATRRRSRKPRAANPAPAAPGVAPQMPPRVSAAMAPWHWRTFPVYFAFSLGGFIGLYLGIISQAVNNSILSLVVFILFASLLGFGLSRITTRVMVSRNWVRPRPPRKK
jgi:VIT1/CCC1 family predicted Fe2+/Mn2+ transporter